MTCKDCVHYEVCGKGVDGAMDRDQLYFESCFPRREEFDCPHFKPKSRFVELPCEVGDYLLWDNRKEVVLKKVKGFRYDPLDLGLRFIIDCCTPVLGCDAIKGILSREEAEKALKEREKE